MDLEDLAPLTYEARMAAKQYARERCAIPGRLGAIMLFDGWRQWKRRYGKFNPHSMSWDQIWAEYKTQLLQDYDDFHEHDVDDMDDERLTRDICLKILESGPALPTTTLTGCSTPLDHHHHHQRHHHHLIKGVCRKSLV
eukprot:scaffold91610_cov58-Attheya_sp.AAC.1